MGEENILEDKVRKIVTGLKEGSDEIRHVLAIGEGLYIRSSDTNMSKSEVALSAVLGAVVKMVEDAMESVNMSCKELTIRSTESSVIVKRAGTAFVIVEVKGIVSGRFLGLLSESGPEGTIEHIDDAIEKIKATLKH